MPFQSSKQRAYLFSQKPQVAKKFAKDDVLAMPKKKKKVKDILS